MSNWCQISSSLTSLPCNWPKTLFWTLEKHSLASWHSKKPLTNYPWQSSNAISATLGHNLHNLQSVGPSWCAVWQAFFQLLGVTICLSLGYHQQSNGQTERKIQEIGRYLRSYCHNHQHSWSCWFPWADYAQNSDLSWKIYYHRVRSIHWTRFLCSSHPIWVSS